MELPHPFSVHVTRQGIECSAVKKPPELRRPDTFALPRYTGVTESRAAGLGSVPRPAFLEAGLACRGSKPHSSNRTVGPSGNDPILSHPFSTNAGVLQGFNLIV